MRFLLVLLLLPLVASGATTLAPGTYTVAMCPSTPPVITPPVPTGTTFWIYQGGQFNWFGDYSWNTGPINYKDTSGKPTAGAYDVAVPIIAQWGGFQPYAQDKKFDVSPYKYVIYSLKPTIANQIFATVFNAINDIQDGTPVTFAGPNITKYGPIPQPGVWATYKVPLADFNLTNQLIQKLTVADGTGVPTNLFFMQSLGFTN